MPSYTKCDWRISLQGNGSKVIKIKAIGESRVSWLDDKEVWVELNVTLDHKGDVAGAEWGDQKGFWPQGATNLMLLQAAARQ